jgi:hypothetical protein
MAKPVKKFKLGNVECAVWENTSNNAANGNGDEEKVYNSYSFQKSYKDKDGKWANTTNYNETDLRTLYALLGGIVARLTKEIKDEAI